MRFRLGELLCEKHRASNQQNQEIFLKELPLDYVCLLHHELVKSFVVSYCDFLGGGEVLLSVLFLVGKVLDEIHGRALDQIRGNSL